MLEFDIDFPLADLAVKDLSEETQAAVGFAVAFEIEAELRKQSTTIWPQRTGYSRDRFRANAEAASGDIVVTNTAPYAHAVNDFSQYRSGRSNPNYLSAQRTVQRWWDKIVRRAAAKADRAIDRHVTL